VRAAASWSWRWLGLRATLVPWRCTRWPIFGRLVSDPWRIVGRSLLEARLFDKSPRSRSSATRSAVSVPSLAGRGGEGGRCRADLRCGLSILAGRGGGGDCDFAQLSSCSLMPVLSQTLLASLLHPPASMVVAWSSVFGSERRLLQELFSGGMGRLALFLLSGLDGCRAPAPQLQCCIGFYSLRCPKWLFPGGGVAAICAESPSAARWTPEGPDRVLRFL
jgi:hypothetical protein